jgi:hypothetical protein
MTSDGAESPPGRATRSSVSSVPPAKVLPAQREGAMCPELVEDGLDLTDVQEMNVSVDERDVYSLRVGDVVLAEGSGSPDSVGRPALWNGELPMCSYACSGVAGKGIHHQHRRRPTPSRPRRSSPVDHFQDHMTALLRPWVRDDVTPASRAGLTSRTVVLRTSRNAGANRCSAGP